MQGKNIERYVSLPCKSWRVCGPFCQRNSGERDPDKHSRSDAINVTLLPFKTGGFRLLVARGSSLKFFSYIFFHKWCAVFLFWCRRDEDCTWLLVSSPLTLPFVWLNFMLVVSHHLDETSSLTSRIDFYRHHIGKTRIEEKGKFTDDPFHNCGDWPFFRPEFPFVWYRSPHVSMCACSCVFSISFPMILPCLFLLCAYVHHPIPLSFGLDVTVVLSTWSKTTKKGFYYTICKAILNSKNSSESFDQ